MHIELHTRDHNIIKPLIVIRAGDKYLAINCTWKKFPVIKENSISFEFVSATLNVAT